MENKQHPMPVLTEQRRQHEISECLTEIEETKKSLKTWGDGWTDFLNSKLLRQQIALSCLTAGPVDKTDTVPNDVAALATSLSMWVEDIENGDDSGYYQMDIDEAKAFLEWVTKE